MKAWQATVEVLRETGNEAVMWGDETLLRLIAKKMGWEHKADRTSYRVLQALTRNPGELIMGKTLTGKNRLVRVFRLSDA